MAQKVKRSILVTKRLNSSKRVDLIAQTEYHSGFLYLRNACMFLSRNERLLSRYKKDVHKIRHLATLLQDHSQEGFLQHIQDLKKTCQDRGFETIRLEALAVALVAADRALRLKAYDVQLMGALALLDGKIAQMKTGEGKTLTAGMAALARSFEGKGVHVVTVNEYLVRRDSATMGKMFAYAGQTVGFVYPGQPLQDKKPLYDCDITYGTNAEIGFDFLRNNMTLNRGQHFMRDMNFAIVDEVDSILIDEARTPLIISAPAEDADALFGQINELALKLRKGSVSSFEEYQKNKIRREINEPHDPSLNIEPVDGFERDYEQASKSQKIMMALSGAQSEMGDYIVDEKKRQVHLTDEGFEHIEQLMYDMKLIAPEDNLYAVHNLNLVYHIEAALKAHTLYRKNIEYIVKDGKVLIVDEFTGRVLPGRRWSNGLHQAIEAKEGVSVEEEQLTAASITLQNLFREYRVLSGMTGTAKTEAQEFDDIYGLEVVEIPTHRPMVRQDLPDTVFLHSDAKYQMILEDIIEHHEKGQPVLVGTTNVKTSEMLAQILKERNIPHEVLNAKQHEREAHIIAQAGKKGAVTIATNMAGRGTDIVLGGSVEEERALDPDADEKSIQQKWQANHDEVVALGGLHVIGTERHESRRIDDQLRGRSGRQGDPGSSRFYVSFDDDLMRLFGGDFARNTLKMMGMKKEQAISSSIVAKQIEKAQRAVEAQNYNIRKELLDFDNVGNEQRQHLYAWRRWLLEQEDHTQYLKHMTETVIAQRIQNALKKQTVAMLEAEELKSIITDAFEDWNLPENHLVWQGIAWEDQNDDLLEVVQKLIDLLPWENQNWVENCVSVVLNEHDLAWREHLLQLDILRKGIHLRGFAQKQPKQEYKSEAYLLFENMVEWAVQRSVQAMIDSVLKPRTQSQPQKKRIEPWKHGASFSFRYGANYEVVRNALCHCGSGKKHKHCHGKLEVAGVFSIILPVYGSEITWNNQPLPSSWSAPSTRNENSNPPSEEGVLTKPVLEKKDEETHKALQLKKESRFSRRNRSA